MPFLKNFTDSPSYWPFMIHIQLVLHTFLLTAILSLMPAEKSCKGITGNKLPNQGYNYTNSTDSTEYKR